MKKYNKIYYRIIFVTMCFVLSSVFILDEADRQK